MTNLDRHLREGNRMAWAKVLGGPEAVPFSALVIGERFRFPKSNVLNVKTSKAGWYRLVIDSRASGRAWRTGAATAVIPVRAS